MNTTLRITMLLTLSSVGCSGSGTSDPETSAAPTSTTDATTTDTPTTDTPTTDTPTSEGPTTGEPDPTTTGDPTAVDSTTGGCPDVALVGDWLSEGDDVAPLLMGFDIESIDATFDDLTFEVVSTDTGGMMITQSGTYTVELCPGSTTKYSIVLDQTMPSAITAEGIYEIDGCQDPAVMQYEVVQTEPPLGTAPTCDDDFGAGKLGADNIQIFRRQ